MGKATPKPIEGARPGPGLLAKLLADKYDDSTPLDRQAKRWRRLGAELSTSTMGDWVAGDIGLLEPLSAEASSEIFVAPSIVSPQYCLLRSQSARWPGPDAYDGSGE